jgi:glycerol-3-phosphate dehydrogenase
VIRDLDRLSASEHDLLVIGGGISGATCAFDAAQRGLRVALVEAADFCSGASWNSLKTIHGGLRHLQRGHLSALRESMRERRCLLRIAAPIVRPLPFLVPTYGHGPKGREALAVGLLLNDLASLDRNRGLSADQRIPRSRTLSRRQVMAELPGLPGAGLTGGALWLDAQVESSERLVMGFLHAAAAEGAALANYVEVTGLLRQGGRVVGVRARDRQAQGELEIRAGMVLSCAGPAVDEVLSRGGVARPAVPLLRAANLVLRRRTVGDKAVGRAVGGRFLFMVPWQDRAMVGTSYLPAASGQIGAAELLEDARAAFPWAELEARDVALVHVGLVPGEGDGSGLFTRHRLIDHQREDGVPGLISVVAVKYTTGRAVAEQAVDLVVARLGRPAAPCRSADRSLPGLFPAGDSPRARTLSAVREEMALHLDDVVLRRLDLGTRQPPEAVQVDEVAGAMAAELGWDGPRLQSERQRLERFYAMASLSQSS